jgi:predicted RNase H-like HicB family nuclease
MAEYMFPAVFSRDDSGAYNVEFPDLEGCYTFGQNISDAMDMASDALCFYLYEAEESETDIPLPTDIETIPCENGMFTSLVKVDTMEYRRFYENKAVKKTLTIPSWLNDMAMRNNINFSETLQSALKKELNVTR